MAATLLAVLTFAAASSAAGAALSTTPVSKVIQLLSDLKSKVEEEGRQEAATYDSFACFCRSLTSSKSTGIITSRDAISLKAAEVEDKTAERRKKQGQHKGRQAKGEMLSKGLKEKELECAKERSEYEKKAADLDKAISSMEKAVRGMEESKPASFLSVRRSVRQSLQRVSLLSLVAEARRKEIGDFIQTAVDPTDPVYTYHAQGILEVLNKLLAEFRAEKQTLETEWHKTEQTCTQETSALESKIQTNSDALGLLVTGIATLQQEIAQSRLAVVSEEESLKNDQLYLKDLTVRCEARAKDWDQRSEMRARELDSLGKVLTMMQSDVASRDAEANQRAALLQERGSSRKAVEPLQPAMALAPAEVAALSFLQEASSRGQSSRRALATATQQAKQERALAWLQKEAIRLQSATISSVAAHVAAGPFTKVKQVIQTLVERLLSEAGAETGKKGFCDKQVAKAKTDRDFRFEETQKLSTEIKALQVKEDMLQEEITTLTQEVSDLTTALNTTTTERREERAQNLRTIATAEEALTAVGQAITILKVFYQQAGKASVLAQAQASPVDADTDGAGFQGAYTGKQQSSKAIIGMLEVIRSDFDRTHRLTTAAEIQAQQVFVEFERTSKADISGKSAKQTRDEEDLHVTQNAISAKMSELKTTQDLVDEALRALSDLEPMCIDTGMSYAERKAKREQEIEALKKALCMLDGDGVEEMCTTATPTQ